jgi:hypothetical protein
MLDKKIPQVDKQRFVAALFRPLQACNNTTPCPVNCTGSFQVLNSTLCTGVWS